MNIFDPQRFLHRRVTAFMSGTSYELAQAVPGGGLSYAYLGRPLRAPTLPPRSQPETVFVKILAHPLLHEADYVREFRAYQVASQHRALTTVSDWGRIDGQYLFLVMDYMAGGTLEQALASPDARPWSLRQRLLAFDRLCSAVEHLHSLGYLHGDIKLANILLAQPDELDGLALTDFSLADRVHPGGSESRQGIEGTPFERAPEQAHGYAPVSSATDVFSLAYPLVALVWGLAAARRLGEAVEMAPTGQVTSPPLHGPREVERLRLLLVAMTTRTPARRPPVREIRRRLRKLYPDVFRPRSSPQPRWPLVCSLALVLLLTIAGLELMILGVTGGVQF